MVFFMCIGLAVMWVELYKDGTYQIGLSKKFIHRFSFNKKLIFRNSFLT